MINSSIALLGVALQNGDTAATTPQYKHGLTGGGLINIERSIDQKAVACGLRANAANSSYVSEVNLGVDFETNAYADVLGLYAMATLGNVVSTAVTDLDGYYKHVITLGSSIPQLTFWGQLGDTSLATVQKASGCKMDTLSLDFTGNEPITIGVTAAGIAAELFGSWADVTSPSCFDGYFVPTSGTFKLDTNSNTPLDALVTEGSFELSNNINAKRGAGQVVPSMLAEGKLTSNVSVTVTPEDWTLYRKLLTGSETGTTVTPTIVYGSTSWHFTHSQDSNCTLDVEFQNVPFSCDSPEVDPEGDAVDLEFSADDVGIASKDGTPVTITIVNKVASYEAASA
jgi:hypothetical protein